MKNLFDVKKQKSKGLSFSGRIPRLQRGDLGSIPSRSIFDKSQKGQDKKS